LIKRHSVSTSAASVIPHLTLHHGVINYKDWSITFEKGRELEFIKFIV